MDPVRRGQHRPGTDLALHAHADASSTDQDGNGAANATDGDSGTRWSSAYEDHQWIQVDLGSARTFDRVAVVWETAYPKSYTIQVSDDGEKWSDVKSVSNTPHPLKTVRLSWPTAACSSRHPVLTAEAYNSPVMTLRG